MHPLTLHTRTFHTTVLARNNACIQLVKCKNNFSKMKEGHKRKQEAAIIYYIPISLPPMPHCRNSPIYTRMGFPLVFHNLPSVYPLHFEGITVARSMMIILEVLWRLGGAIAIYNLCSHEIRG